MRAALKVMHPILSCWLMLSEVNVSGMAEEVEPSCQYSVTFCCCMTDGSRRAVWQDGVWRRNAYEVKLCIRIPLCWKMAPTDIHWRLLNVYEDQVIVRAEREWMVRFSSGNSSSGSPLLVQIAMCMTCRLLFMAHGNI